MESKGTNTVHIVSQIGRFGIVGMASTALHVALFTGLVKSGAASPMAANVMAFALAFLLSFFAHFSWTFRCVNIAQKWQVLTMLLRFLVVALIGLGFNTCWVYLVTTILGMAYYYTNFFFLLVTPTILFVCNKFFVFK
jgi:putative flippase GtrA